MAEIAAIKTKTMRRAWTSICLKVSSMTVDFKLNHGKAFDIIKLKKEAGCVSELSKLIVDMILNSRHVTVSGVENFHVEVIGECRKVCAAVDSFAVAQQMLVADDVATVILLLRRATLLQDAIIQMVSSVADSEVKFINVCIKNIRELLCLVCSAKDLRHLGGLTEEYSDAVSQLKIYVGDDNLLIRDAMDIPDMNSAVEKLIKSTSMLTISIESVLKYPEVKAAETNKNSVSGFIQSSLDHLSAGLNQQRSLFNLSWTDPLKLYENEQFSTVCAKIVDLLKTIILIQRTGLDELEMLVNFCIQYAMNLAEKLQDDCQNSVFEACNEIIMNQCRISDLCHNTSLIVLSEDELKQNDLKNLVQLMINSLGSMKEMVSRASLYLAVRMIAGDCSIPALNLLSSFKQFGDSIAEGKNHVTFSKSKPEYFVDVFEQYLKTISNEWKLVIFGSSGTLKNILEMHRYLVDNETVGRSIVSLAKELIENNLYDSPTHIDRLTMICDEWCSGVQSLPSNISRIFNSSKMLFVCGEMIMKLVSKLQHSAAASNDSLEEMAVLNGRCFCKLAAKVMDGSVDARARRNLRIKIAALEQELNLGDDTNQNNAALGLKCDYQKLWRATYDICCCVETGHFKEESIEVINVALKSLVYHAMSGSSPTVLEAAEVNFNFLTSLGIHGSAAAEMTAIVSRLIFHTISSSLKAEIAGEQLLSASTHLLHSTLLVIDTVEKKERRHFILEKLSQLTDLVPTLLEEAEQVKRCKNHELKLLYELGEKCCDTMCFLVDYINEILNRWNPIPKNLVNAALAHDWGWLKKEMVELSSQMLAFKELTAIMTNESFLFDDNMETLTGCEDMEAFIKEIESIYDRILFLTKQINSSSQHEDDIVSQIRFLSRDWSAKLYFLMNRIDRTDHKHNEFASPRSGDTCVQWMTQEAADLRREIYLRFQMHSSSEAEEISKCVDDLQIILKKVKDFSQTSKDLFASQKLHLFSSLWKSKVRKVRVLIEKNSMLAVEVNSESSTSTSHLSSLEQKICISDKFDDKHLTMNIEDHHIDVRTAKPSELSNKETLKKSAEQEFIRSTKDQLTAEAILYKGNHQTHFPLDSKCKISSPVVDGIIANGSILDSIDEMSETANQLLADIQSDEKSTQDQKTDLLQVLKVNEKKMLHISTALLTNCNDVRIREELSCTVEGVRSTLLQIYILIGVKSAVHDRNADDANIKTVIGRLLNLLTKLKCNFKAVCVRGLKQSTLHSVGDRDAYELAEQWKINWMQINNRSSLQARKDRLGLRTVTAVPK